MGNQSITICCWVQIYARRRAESSLLKCKPVQEHSYRYLAIPNIYTIATFVSLYNNNVPLYGGVPTLGEFMTTTTTNGVTWAKKAESN